MPVFVYDTFTDANSTALGSHTGELGATWTEHGSFTTGDAKIQSNRAFADSANFTLYYASGAMPHPDCVVESQVNLVSVSGGYQIALCARVNTGANTLYFMRFRNTNELTIFKTVAGSSTQLASVTTATAAIGENHTMRFIVRGSTLMGYWDGTTLVGPVTDTDITAAGRVGLRWDRGSSTTGYHADYLRASTTPIDSANGIILARRRRR